MSPSTYQKYSLKLSEPPLSSIVKSSAPSIKYIEPKDITIALIDDDGKEWKFCAKYKCRKTEKVGIYQLSHFDSQHIDNFAAASEGNLASVHDPDPIPSGVPAVTTS